MLRRTDFLRLLFSAIGLVCILNPALAQQQYPPTCQPSQFSAACQGICMQYCNAAVSAGANGTYAPLVNLYNQCMACQRTPARRSVRCPAGYMTSEDGPNAQCILITCPRGTVRDVDGSCIDARRIQDYSPEE